MVKSNNPLQIRLTEPVTFLRGPSTGTDFRGRPQTIRDGQPAMVRGLLTLRLHKPTRIRNITVSLEGKSRTEWPEGIGPRRTDTFEEHQIMLETATFFSASDAAAAKLARRSQSAGPASLAQQDLDSDDGDDSEYAHDLPRERGRQPPRSSSVMPSNPEDWMSWHRDGVSRATSRAPSPERGMQSRQASTMSLTALPAQEHSARGPSPAYTPYSPTSNISRQSSIVQSPSIIPVRGVPDLGSTDTDGRRLGSQMGLADLTEDQEWQPTTPAGNPEEVINLGPVTDPGPPTSTAIRFCSPTRISTELPESSEQAETAGSPLASQQSRADSLRTIESSVSSDSAHRAEYHPVRAGHQTAVTTPVSETPPAGTPHCGSPELNHRSSYDFERPTSSRRRSSGLRTNTTEDSSSAIGSVSGRVDAQQLRGSATRDQVSSSRASDPPSSVGTPAITPAQEELHRKHHHQNKFSLAAALRGLSQDVKDRVRTGSRPGSRASSRTRGNETPRSAHFQLPESAVSSMPMSRNNSGSGTPLRAAVEDLHIGRGHRSRSRDNRGQSPGRHEDSRGRSRNRMFGGKDDDGEIHNWKEFRKGIYNYPISFPIPLNAPPTVHAEFGSVIYKLKATVVRVGALTPNLVEEMEINMVAGPQEDDMEETDNVIVERQWEDQMRYQIALSGKAFPIGGVIPMSIRLMPLSKCKIYRLTVALEEKTDYYAVGRKVARHETPRRFILFSAKNGDGGKKERAEPLLPILSESVSAIKDSPLAKLARNAALNNPREFADYSNPEDDVYASLLDPLGPWHLEKDLSVPDCNTRIKFTTKHDQTNITVGHWLKVTIRVERGDDVAVDSKGRRKQFDIIIETPVKLLDCRVNPQYNSLPSYDRLGSDQHPLNVGCTVHAKSGGSQVLSRTALIGSSTPQGPSHVAHALMDAALPPFTRSHPQSPQIKPDQDPLNHHAEHEDTLLERNIVYDRLMSGQLTETGEEPPSYGEAVANAIRSARSASRAHSRVNSRMASATPSLPASRNGSRAPSRNASRTRLHLDE